MVRTLALVIGGTVRFVTGLTADAIAIRKLGQARRATRAADRLPFMTNEEVDAEMARHEVKP